MRAVVIRPNDWVSVGTVIEVIGFVWHGGLWAVWRDDYGAISEVPTLCILMKPNVEAAA